MQTRGSTEYVLDDAFSELCKHEQKVCVGRTNKCSSGGAPFLQAPAHLGQPGRLCEHTLYLQHMHSFGALSFPRISKQFF